MVRKRIEQILKAAMERSKEEGALPPDIEIEPIVEIPREKGHGDYASTVSFQLARKARKNPEEIARTLIRNMDAGALCSEVTVAAKGFINFHVRDEVFRSELADISMKGVRSFFPSVGLGKRVIIEFVSANPTGPLHIGHGRGAAVGDVLAAILQRTGHEVVREYYVNDAGRR